MRWLGFVFRLAFLIVLAIWLTHQPGSARIEWHDVIIETSAAILALGVFILAMFLFSLYRFWRFLLDAPRFWKLRQKIKKLDHGQNQLAQGFVAIAAGDGPEAGRLAVGARKLLGSNAATQLLQAQAAQITGDHRAAQEIYTNLAASPETAALGYRGLIMGAIRNGHWDEAEKYIDKFNRIKPNTPWLNLIQFELSTQQHQWEKARESLKNAASQRLIDATKAAHHRAALFLASALEARNEANPTKALHLAEQAYRLNPMWLPAGLILATQQAQTGHPRAARKLIDRLWATQPHPELALLCRTLSSDENDPLSNYKLIEKLTRQNGKNVVSQLALAEAALAADLWGAARRHLLSIANLPDATHGVFRLLAKLERREHGDDVAATQWLLRSTEAKPDPLWLCSSCGGGHALWQPTCSHCCSFNTLEWGIPGESRTKNPLTIGSSPHPALLSE